MSDIFISYARDDRSKVEPLAKALEAKGWSVWWDARIRAGEAFDRLIENALAEAQCVVAVWSNKSVESAWVRAEAGDGLERGILICIAIEDAVRPPLRFRNIHTEPLIDWDGQNPSPAFEKIVGDLEAVLGRPDVPFTTGMEVRPVHSDLDAMVEVSAGEFIYQEDKAIIETPFMIDVYPVTSQQYAKFIKAGGYQNDAFWSNEGKGWREKGYFKEPELWIYRVMYKINHPAAGVSYFEAEAYSKWAEKRLPTEIEWERAARCTDGREWPWGNKFDRKKCNTKESAIEKTTQVTQYPNGISPAGCYDMAGNVWEWTSSWYDSKKDERVLRGGSCRNDCFFSNCATRGRYHPDIRRSNIGFRCARTKK